MKSLLTIALTTALCAACGGSTPTGGCADPQMIDDMEDNDRHICATGGRTGAWFVIDDGTSTNISPRGEFAQNLIPGGRDASRYAAHMTGFGFTDWGAAMGLSLDGDGQPYDASPTSGVRFWMKSNVPVVVGFPIPETTSAGTAAACVDSATSWNCDNHFRFAISAPPGEWTEYDVPYAAVAQDRPLGSAGSTAAGTATWDPARLLGVQFNVDALQTFDVWVDDVRFYSSCPAGTCVPTCTDPGLPVACPAIGATPARCRPAGATCQALSAHLPGVWGTASDDVWAVGYGGTILHWNGAAWSLVPSGTTEWLSVPAGSGRDDVWAVGVNGTIVHWNGTAWSAVTSGTAEPLYGVWASGPADAWAVGAAGTIIHWDGSVWSPVSSSTSYGLWRVWGSGPDDVYAVGSSDTSSAAVIVHWEGSTWSTVESSPPFNARGVGGSGPADVWVSGGAGGLVHWDGSVWSPVASGTDLHLTGLWASGPNDAWATGAAGAVVHWNGSSWTPVPSGTPAFLGGVWASGPSDAWAVGWEGTILHWDGTAWSLVPVEVQ